MMSYENNIFLKLLNYFLSSRVNPATVSAREYTLWDSFKLPEDISTTGKYIDWLFNYITLWNIFYFALVCIGLFGFSYLYHHKRNKVPLYTHGYKKQQLAVTFIIGLAVFLTIDIFIAAKSSYDLKAYFWNFPSENEETIKIEVAAQQWMWTFRHAGPDNEFNTVDDIVTNHDLYIPVNKKVEIRLTSKDVIHSFYLPNARTKIDAMPGRISRLWFEATKTGVFDIACAEMCGTNHYKMQAKLIIYEQKDYQEWLTQAHKIATYGLDPDHKEFNWGWPWRNEK